MTGGLPQVTVVTPVFNGADYLAEAIESVLTQAVPLRYIVVDDGSTDATAEILATFGNRITVVTQSHQGHAAALNAGLRLLDTPWVAFNDADDLWDPDKLACQMAAALANPQAQLIIGHCLEFASGEALQDPDRWTVRQDATPGYGSGGILIRSDLVTQLNGFDERLTYGVFVDLIARAKKVGCESVLHEEVVFRRRIHGNNMSMNVARARQDYLAIARAQLLRGRTS